MLQGGGRDHAIGNAKWLPGSLASPVEDAPALGDSLRDGKNSPRKPERDGNFDKLLQLRPPGALRKQRDASTKSPIVTTLTN